MKGAPRSHAGLTANGAVAALVVGACAIAGGRWRFVAVLLAFFVSSILLSRYGRAQKDLRETDKHGARDERQVFANGGVAALCAVITAFTHNALAACAFAAAFAAANADTWGTEIGMLARETPRSIANGKPLPTGLSGGITFTGTLAEIAGAAFVALVAAVAGVAPALPVAVGGIAGALADSIAGALVQSKGYCDACAVPCEAATHRCGARTRVVGGFARVGNDAVNLLCTTIGAGVAVALAAFRL